MLGKTLTDEGGEARISLKTDGLFPVAATITVSDGTTPVVQAKIQHQGANGLYPGDVWALDLRHKPCEVIARSNRRFNSRRRLFTVYAANTKSTWLVVKELSDAT